MVKKVLKTCKVFTEHWKVLTATTADRQEKFSNSRRSRMAKTIFWPWWQPFNSFYFETPSFLPLSSFFSFCYAKKSTPPPPPPTPVSPALKFHFYVACFVFKKVLVEFFYKTNTSFHFLAMMFYFFSTFSSKYIWIWMGQFSFKIQGSSSSYQLHLLLILITSNFLS